MGKSKKTMKLKKELIKLDSRTRLYHYEKPIIALTGGIATGKSSVMKMIEKKGIKIIDADQLVKSIYQTSDAREFIQKNVKDAWVKNEINFSRLRELFFHDIKIKKIVETFIYARLPKAFQAAADKCKDQNFYLYDVPLLFEKGMDSLVDLAVVVYAPPKIQRARLMDRDGHLEEMADKILSHQLSIDEKKLKADLVIDNSGSLIELAANVENFLQQVLE